MQHQDGHSQLIAATIPNCISYDPAYAYELAVIIQDGMRRMFEEGENCFYYITTMNENYLHPDMPEGVEEGIVRGLYRLRASNRATVLPHSYWARALFCAKSKRRPKSSKVISVLRHTSGV